MKPLGLKIIKNEAFLHNYKISDLANKYQTPLYIMDEEQINRSIQDYLTFFKSDAFHTSVVYASKAFLTTAFVKYIDSHGLFIDAVSLGDLYVIHKAGFTMEKVVFHGNNKSIAELQYAIETNVGIIVVDNLF